MRVSKKITALAGTVLLGGAIVGIMQNPKSNATTEPPLVTEVRHQGEVLDNHEDRITNLETDVTAVQQSTNTPSSSNKVVVREVQTASPTEPIYTEPTQAATPVVEEPKIVVTAYEAIPVPGTENVECKLTYSDGTVKQWLWKTVEYNQGSKIVRTSGTCDASVIGQVKPSAPQPRG